MKAIMKRLSDDELQCLLGTMRAYCEEAEQKKEEERLLVLLEIADWISNTGVLSISDARALVFFKEMLTAAITELNKHPGDTKSDRKWTKHIIANLQSVQKKIK